MNTFLGVLFLSLGIFLLGAAVFTVARLSKHEHPCVCSSAPTHTTWRGVFTVKVDGDVYSCARNVDIYPQSPADGGTR